MQIHILMDLAEGMILSQYYKGLRDGRMAESEACKIFQQIVEAVAYLHKTGIFHRDLKTENVIIDQFKKIKIIDFGFSIRAEPMQRLNLFCGTPNYMSPEIILKKEYYGGPSDIWALGVLLYVICAGQFPFKGKPAAKAGKNDKELHKKILGIELVYPTFFSSNLKSLIGTIMQYSPLSRPSCEQILEHTWFKQ